MKNGILIALGISLAATLWFALQNQNLRKELKLAMDYQNQLQELSQSNAEQRLQFESEINSLNSQLRSSAFQLSNLSSSLQEARLQADPEFEALLEQARQEVAREAPRAAPRRTRSPFSTFSDPDSALALANDNIPRMYDSFINALGIPGTERQQVMDAMVNFASQRYQMLDALVDGSLSRDDAIAYFGADALAQSLGLELNTEQLADLRVYDQLLRQDTLREVYQQALNRTGNAIDGMSQDRVIDGLIGEVLSAENNWGALVAEDGSMLSAYNDKISAFDRARENLAPDLNGEQLGQLDRFIEAQISGVDVILEASTDSSGRVSITQARIGPENLSQ